MTPEEEEEERIRALEQQRAEEARVAEVEAAKRKEEQDAALLAARVEEERRKAEDAAKDSIVQAQSDVVSAQSSLEKAKNELQDAKLKYVDGFIKRVEETISGVASTNPKDKDKVIDQAKQIFIDGVPPAGQTFEAYLTGAINLDDVKTSFFQEGFPAAGLYIKQTLQSYQDASKDTLTSIGKLEETKLAAQKTLDESTEALGALTAKYPTIAAGLAEEAPAAAAKPITGAIVGASVVPVPGSTPSPTATASSPSSPSAGAGGAAAPTDPATSSAPSSKSGKKTTADANELNARKLELESHNISELGGIGAQMMAWLAWGIWSFAPLTAIGRGYVQVLSTFTGAVVVGLPVAAASGVAAGAIGLTIAAARGLGVKDTTNLDKAYNVTSDIAVNGIKQAFVETVLLGPNLAVASANVAIYASAYAVVENAGNAIEFYDTVSIPGLNLPKGLAAAWDRSSIEATVEKNIVSWERTEGKLPHNPGSDTKNQAALRARKMVLPIRQANLLSGRLDSLNSKLSDLIIKISKAKDEDRPALEKQRADLVKEIKSQNKEVESYLRKATRTAGKPLDNDPRLESAYFSLGVAKSLVKAAQSTDPDSEPVMKYADARKQVLGNIRGLYNDVKDFFKLNDDNYKPKADQHNMTLDQANTEVTKLWQQFAKGDFKDQATKGALEDNLEALKFKINNSRVPKESNNLRILETVYIATAALQIYPETQRLVKNLGKAKDELQADIAKRKNEIEPMSQADIRAANKNLKELTSRLENAVTEANKQVKPSSGGGFFENLRTKRINKLIGKVEEAKNEFEKILKSDSAKPFEVDESAGFFETVSGANKAIGAADKFTNQITMTATPSAEAKPIEHEIELEGASKPLPSVSASQGAPTTSATPTGATALVGVASNSESSKPSYMNRIAASFRGDSSKELQPKSLASTPTTRPRGMTASFNNNRSFNQRLINIARPQETEENRQRNASVSSLSSLH